MKKIKGQKARKEHTTEEMINAGIAHMLSQVIYDLERNGLVTRVWSGSRSNVRTHSGCGWSWSVRITEKWSEKLSKV
jgi:hypothetical protein